MDAGSARGRPTNLEAAASQARLGLWEYEPEGSRFHGSEVVHEIFGLEVATEVALETVSSLYAPESAGMLVRAIELALQDGKPFSFFSEILTPSGQRRWIRTQGQVAEGHDGQSRRVFGTVQDISDIRLLDRVTQQSEMTLNQVEQITHIGHWSVSPSDGSLYHSDEIKRIFGYEPSEYALSVEDAINAYHPDDREEVIRLFNRAMETGEGYEFDLRIVQPSGDTRHVHSKGYTELDAQGNVTRLYGVFQDVTEQVLAEQALRESEASMKALIDVVRTAIVVHGKDGEVLLSNQMANRLLAPLVPDVLGRPVTDPAWRFIDEEGRDVPVEELPVSMMLRTREPVENRIMGRRDGDSLAWLLVNGGPVLDENGEISKIIMSFVDITEHKQMEDRLRQSEKMRAIGQLAGGVAHDFNNQLMVMSAFAERLKRSFEDDSVERSYVQGILSGVARSADLTKQLLAFARKGKYVVTTVDLNRLIAETVSMAAHSFDKKIRITHQANAKPATIAGDASQLQNALLNMALNSRDAMPDGGELVFTTDRVTLERRPPTDDQRGLAPGDYVRVTIRDTGQGMDSATQKRVFEPFFTTKEQGKGSGMGMASVYGTVEIHHGAIEIESEQGSGTTVTMHFPWVPAVSEAASENEAKTGAAGAGRILIIDDEEGVAAALGMMLDTSGYETTTCANGREALRVFEKSWRSTDLVLLDMIMPEMGGAEAFYALKAIDPAVKVVLISGYSFTNETRKIIEDGAAGFLLKPVTSQDLLQTISSVLGTAASKSAPSD